MLTKLYDQLAVRLEEHKNDIFQSPPKDYTEFRERTARHDEVQKLMDIVSDVIKGREDE